MTHLDFRLAAMWSLFVISWALWVSVLVKTKWWRSAAGINVMVLSGWFCFTMTLIISATMGVLPELLRLWGGLLIYGGGALILLWRLITIWVWNWNFWAWSKTERGE